MKYEYVKFIITEESNPSYVANKINDKANNYGKNGNLETEAILKAISRPAKYSTRFPIGNGKFIDPKNIKEINEYINMIIDNLDIEDEDIKKNVVNTIYKLREFLPLAADGKL